MRPAMEIRPVADVLDVEESDLMQILSHVVEEVRESIGREINGADLLYSLLNAPWLQSLLKVYESLQQHLTSSTSPCLSYASGLSLEILSDLRALPYPSHEARELYSLLTEPHLQALLSAHDTVGLKDYEPVLPPLPEDLPDEEEAMRIICLVKNKQPLSGVGRGFRSHWDTLRKLTRQRLIPGQRARVGGFDIKKEGVPEKPINTPVEHRILPQPITSSQQSSKHGVSCKLCPHSNALWDRSLSCSAPCVCNLVVVDPEDDFDMRKPLVPVRPHCASLSPWTHVPQSYLSPCCCCPSYVSLIPPGVTRPARTAPTSPTPRRWAAGTGWTPTELAGQGSLDELRSMVVHAATRMDRSSQDVEMLGRKMADATERMSGSIQENSRALATLAKAVERLQGLVAASKGGQVSEEAVDGNGWDEGGNFYGAGSTCSNAPRSPGATIRRDEMTGEIYVARVIHGGLADRSGLLHAGDRLVEVNGHPVFGLEPEQIIQILARSHGTVMFKVVPITDRPVNNQTMLYVRAMADYSPQQDPAIPCADAGMAFRKGDLLEIVDQTDALWWQAKKLPCSSACAGLIPSASLLKRKQREFWWSQPYQPHTCIKTLSRVDEEDDILAIDVTFVETDEEAFESEELREEESEFSTNIEGIYLAGFRRSLRLCRRRRAQGGGSGLPCSPRCLSSCCCSALANPYEDVVRYQRQPEDPYRLIALLGASGVGVNELRRRLIEINPKIYQGATPHTTRPPKCHEEPGQEYHFISRDQFENMVYNHSFVEYGEYKGHLYGTSLAAVKDVLTAGKICVIDIEPYAIESVRTHDLRAYIIYIKPPPLDQMKRTRMSSQLITSYYTSRPFKDEDFHEIEEAGRRMEQHYGQFFDHVIVNDGLQASCVQLLTAVRRAQDDPQWVPSSWIRPTNQR